MISFSTSDYIVIIIFFLTVLTIGFFSARKLGTQADDYLLSGRKVGLFLFILTNVSAWYGGILGVGEFTYRYGLVSWFTQGFPYYLFAFLFAIFFAEKIRNASLFTIPDKLSKVYGEKTGLISSLFVFVLVSPAPYLLMTANLISLLFGTGTVVSLIISLILSMAYLLQGGFKANVYTDSFQFFVMFGGFILILFFAYLKFGGVEFLSANLPASHLKVTGGASPTFILIWFLIALWTFADPGFHQRCYAAKTGKVAKKGIIISIIFFALFDFLTTSTGLYSRAVLPDINQPVQSYPLLAEKILGPGLKGIFYSALFATIISTANSFLFLSGTTIGRDFIFKLSRRKEERELKLYTIYGLIISGILSIILSFYIPSVIETWYTIGSFCIPGIILAVISSYYPKIMVSSKIIISEMFFASLGSIIWFIMKSNLKMSSVLNEVEPMLVGLLLASLIHIYGLKKIIFRKIKS